MLTQAQIKLIRSLSDKKVRRENQLFIVEGPKCVGELLHSRYNIRAIFALKEWAEEAPEKLKKNITIINEDLLERISHLSKPNKVLALVDIQKSEKIEPEYIKESILILDGINDPGNLGTIIRLCHWFGIKKIICSKNTVDVYNPKVIQSTMGSFAYVEVFYEDLPELISRLKLPVYCANMEGDNIFKNEISSPFVLIMGSESHGVSKELLNLSKPITIPSFQGNNPAPESLNVAIAASVILSQIVSRQ
jgi:TrmH family RNA methyltransferase